MKINEITNTLKTYAARVKLNTGSWVKTSIEAENSSQAMLLLKHLYLSVSSVTELTEQENELDEATATKTPQQLQVQSLANQEKKIKQQKKQLIARQAMAKAQEKMRQANQASIQGTL
jgi:regulation of enolase protein 1 (concanavalin A-like superfamily)